MLTHADLKLSDNLLSIQTLHGQYRLKIALACMSGPKCVCEGGIASTFRPQLLARSAQVREARLMRAAPIGHTPWDVRPHEHVEREVGGSGSTARSAGMSDPFNQIMKKGDAPKIGRAHV